MLSVHERNQVQGVHPPAGGDPADPGQCVVLRRPGEGLGNGSRGFHFCVCFVLKQLVF